MARPRVILHKWISVGFTKSMEKELDIYKRVQGIKFIGDAIKLLLAAALSRTLEKDLIEAKELLRVIKYEEITKDNQQEVLTRIDKLLEE